MLFFDTKALLLFIGAFCIQLLSSLGSCLLYMFGLMSFEFHKESRVLEATMSTVYKLE